VSTLDVDLVLAEVARSLVLFELQMSQSGASEATVVDQVSVLEFERADVVPVVSNDLACRWIGYYAGCVIGREGLPQVGTNKSRQRVFIKMHQMRSVRVR